MSRVVCDPNCLISGMLWREGSPGAIISRIEKGPDILLITDEIMAEIAEVIQRPKFERVLTRAGLVPSDLLRELSRCALFVEPSPLTDVVVKDDPDDDAVFACAATAVPDYIISGDRHLLGLSEWRAIPILSPRAYLGRVA